MIRLILLTVLLTGCDLEDKAKAWIIEQLEPKQEAKVVEQAPQGDSKGTISEPKQDSNPITNCSPKKSSDCDAAKGCKFMASNAEDHRNGSAVILLPADQYTCPPYKQFTNHHGATMAVNANNDYPEKVEITNDKKVLATLYYSTCVNWVDIDGHRRCRPQYRPEKFDSSTKHKKLAKKATKAKVYWKGNKTTIKLK